MLEMLNCSPNELGQRDLEDSLQRSGDKSLPVCVQIHQRAGKGSKIPAGLKKTETEKRSSSAC